MSPGRHEPIRAEYPSRSRRPEISLRCGARRPATPQPVEGEVAGRARRVLHAPALVSRSRIPLVGFPDLWLTRWLTPGRSVPLNVWGPRGTTNIMSHLRPSQDRTSTRLN